MKRPHGVCRCVSAGAVLLGLAIIGFGGKAARAADGYSEDAVKAAYLYRFAGYVNWPDEPAAEGPFTIAVLGSPGVARELRHLVPGHLINNRPVEIREITGFPRSEVPAAGLPSLLLVTDEEGGLNAGSALNFLMVDRRVRFEVSLTAADRSGLKISSDLLGVAVRVRGGGRQTRDGCLPFSLADAGDGGCAIRVARRGLRRDPPNRVRRPADRAQG
jgi:hypothetical protein